MTASEKLMRKKKVYKAELDKATPMSGELWERATVRLGEIRTKYGTLPKGIRAHTDKIFPAAAVYLTVKEELGEKTAYSVLENASIRLCAEVAPKLAKLMKLPGMRGLFVKLWDPMTRKMFGPENGFRNVFYPRKKGEYRMDVISCPYFRYFTELGCPEITKFFCENDDRIYGCLPGLEFLRTGTLGKGAEKCDFRMKKEEYASFILP